MKPRIAILDDYQTVALANGDWDRVGDRADITVFSDHIADESALAARLEPFAGVVLMRERTPFPRTLLDRLPNLKLIATSGMWNASVDLVACEERGIIVSGTQTSGSGTSQVTWALILALAQQITTVDRDIREGRWQTGLGDELEGKTLGLLGLGRVGTKVARVAPGFGMNVVAWSSNMTAEKAAAAGATLVERDELFAKSDFVSVHLVLGPRSRGLIGKAELALMKPTAFLINTSRGPIVDEAALIDALRRQIIAGAGLDVFDVEPLPLDHPLRTLPNTVLTPHIGYASKGSYALFYGQMLEDVEAWLNGAPIRQILSTVVPDKNAHAPEAMNVFAAEVRAFVAAELPAAVREKVRAGEEIERAEYVDWQRRLFARGWAAPGWPVEHGGCGWDAQQRWIFDRELAAGWAPRNVNSGMFMLGPVLIEFGTPEQQARYLPPILAAEDWWCQGFSEPNAGSDLASLRTSAVRDGDDYVVNGEKVWVTFAQHATKMFFLARTDATVKPQAGISFLLTEMGAPGLTVTPIATADGYAEINAVSFVNVRVPVANRIGAEGQGWTCAKFLLFNERDVAADIGGSLQLVERIRPFVRDPGHAAELAELEIRLTMLAHAQLRASGGPSYLKLAGTEVQQALLRLFLDVAGSGVPRDVTANYLNARKLSIYAGTNEVHRDLLARYLLGA